MALLRFVCLVAAFCSLCYPDTLAATPVPACTNEGDWCRLDQQRQYPPCYSSWFMDSLLIARQVTPAHSLRTLDSVPFIKGEKFVYDVGWGPLRAGFVILETTPDSSNGQVVVVGKGMTNDFFGAFYKVRDYIRTTMDMKGMYPFFFEQHLREGRYKDDRWELFDQANCRVFTYKKDADSLAAQQFVQNYFSLFLYIRTRSFTPGDSFFADCFVHSKTYRISMHCFERKAVEVEAGVFNCLLIKPVLVGEGRVFTKKDEIRLWLTDDQYKMPVMIRARIALGSITARLIWYERKE
jgi:hypothetical protein